MKQSLSPENFIGFHLTGKIRALLPIMLEAKPDSILRFESPRFGGDISLEEGKDMYGDRICIMGGYDPHVYVLGDREDIHLETKRCIDEAAAGGGYIYANTDHISEEMKIEDVKFMVDAAKEYGCYA
jgi:uroporphyrinogen decarboxylase